MACCALRETALVADGVPFRCTGPVGQFLRIERCERLQLIVATKRITISTCHDCTFFLGVNRPPCLIGDSRFIQMAPYCTQYDALGGHMASVGVVPSVNKWDQAITVAHTNHSGSSTRLHAPDSPKTGAPRLYLPARVRAGVYVLAGRTEGRHRCAFDPSFLNRPGVVGPKPVFDRLGVVR